jgi:undecaprenyl-diphosphatase
MEVIDAILLAIVEGLTEFLPVSSTGHMIIVSALLGISDMPFTKLFEVNIQFGAILSVVVLYYKRFFQSIEFYIKLLIAFIPAAVIGFLLGDQIDKMLESVTVVAVMLMVGGVVLLFIDKLFNAPDTTKEFSRKDAFIVGLFQCIAMIPGVSRSAATIIGGMTQKFTREKAAEFSFFLAVPTMFAASAYKLLGSYEQIKQDSIGILLLGNIVAFIVGLIAIKFFIGVLTKYGFKWFGYYRIALGGLLLILLALGVDLKVL